MIESWLQNHARIAPVVRRNYTRETLLSKILKMAMFRVTVASAISVMLSDVPVALSRVNQLSLQVTKSNYRTLLNLKLTIV